MHSAKYYREQAAHTRRLAQHQVTRHTVELLKRVAQDFDEVAEDIELGAIEIRHPELLPQNRPRSR
jgi:hypothetical protein